MKFKLDENIGRRGREILASAGHDVATVVEEALTGAEDSELIEMCRLEHRCLVTMDLDFANPLAFAPSRYPGIAVLRLPSKASSEKLLGLVRTLCGALESEAISGHLWIVEIGRIRIYKRTLRHKKSGKHYLLCLSFRIAKLHWG